MVQPLTSFGNWPWESKEENGLAESKYRFTLTSIRHPKYDKIKHRFYSKNKFIKIFIYCRPRCIGFARRRIGRGGRVILDRISTDMDDYWASLDYTIYDSDKTVSTKKLKNSNCEMMTNDSSSIVVALKTDIDDISSSLKHNKNISEQIVGTRTNNNHFNNVINNDKLSVDMMMQDTIVGIKKEIIDNEFDKILLSNNSVNNFYSNNNSVTNVLRDSKLKNENNLSQNSSSGISSMISSLTSTSMVSSNISGDFNNTTTTSTILNKQNSQQIENLENSKPTVTNELLINNSICEENIPLAKLNHLLNDDDNEIKYNNSMDLFYEDIQKNWLHFRPKTPEPSLSPPLEDIPQYLETTPLCVELQTLGSKSISNNLHPSHQLLSSSSPPLSSIFMENNDNLFLSNAFSLSDILDDPFTIPGSSTLLDASSSASSNGSELNSSGGNDSLNELNLSLGETNEDNEKMLDTILQDCQIEDLKSFHTNTNFWNGILEDTGFLNSLDIAAEDKKSNEFGSKSGYDSEFLNEFRDRDTKIGGTLKKKCSSRIGHSSFSVSNCIKENFFKKEMTTTTTTTQQTKKENLIENNDDSILKLLPTGSGGLQGTPIIVGTGNAVDDIKIKLENLEHSGSGTNNNTQQINSIYLQSSLNPNSQTGGGGGSSGSLQVGKMNTSVTGVTENMIVLSSPIRKHINGPSNDKTGM